MIDTNFGSFFWVSLNVVVLDVYTGWPVRFEMLSETPLRTEAGSFGRCGSLSPYRRHSQPTTNCVDPTGRVSDLIPGQDRLETHSDRVRPGPVAFQARLSGRWFMKRQRPFEMAWKDIWIASHN